jgi:hypothetical protein
MIPAKPITLQQFVQEWFVEDACRYERLTRTSLPEVVRGVHTVHGRKVKDSVTSMVISCVLTVPLQHADAVTTMLRDNPNRSPTSPYLSRAAEAADREVAKADRVYELELLVERLKRLAREMARSADEVHFRTGFGGFASAADYVEHSIGLESVDVRAERSRVNAALTERAADVAAQILISIPDEP